MKTIILAQLPQLAIIIFWVLLLLWGLGAFAFRAHPAWPRASNIVLIILFAILGYGLFKFGF